MSAPVPRQSLSDKVYQHLKAMLASQQIKVGDRVNTRQIATELNVSRTTAMKAISQLISDGLIAIDSSRHPVVVSLPTKLKVHDDSSFTYLNQTDNTYELLLEKILSGQFGPGEIIKERPLAIAIGVNAATVRRAAEWLSNDGLLERLPRRGWRVTLLSPREVRDVYKIRILLEPTAVAAAVHRITEKEIEDLEQQTQQLISLGERATVYERREADHEFHRVISEASGNTILAKTLEPLFRKVLLLTTVGFRYGRATRSFEEHRELLKALRARDEKLSVKRIKVHLRNAMRFNAEIWDSTLNL